MPASRSVGQGVAPPSEASFVLRRHASAIWVQPQGRRLELSTAPSDANRHASPPTAPTAGRSRAAQEAASKGTGDKPLRGDVAAAESAAPKDGPTPQAGARIGVISDNHGYLDPAVLEIFAGVTHIIHAGDIMDAEILNALRAVAPVTAVAGNMDSGGSTAELQREVAGEVAGVRFVVGHKRKRLLKRLAARRIEGGPEGQAPDLVIYGHDHVAAAAWVDGTLFLNPGTASSPDDEDDGPTVAIVEVTRTGLAVLFVPLERRDADEASAHPGRP
jgi:putative phosphoesterase